jgi:DNA polymerase-3 subunit beta
MRFSCQRDDLNKAIQAVSGVVASKGVHPIYESVEILANDGSLTFQATDLEIGMRVRVPASDALKLEQGGTAVVPAQKLAQICRELPPGEVSFSWDAEKRQSSVSAARSRFKLLGQSPEDFPEIPDTGDAPSVTVSAKVLHDMIRRTAFAAAKERMRFALNGVHLHVEGESIELVATDGRRLARDVGTCTNPNGVTLDAIVPTKGLQQLDKALHGGEQEVQLAVGNNHFSGRTEQVTVVSRLVEGTFPPYQDVIPASCSRRAVLPRESLQAALKRVSLVTTRDAQTVKLTFAPDALKVAARSADGSAEEIVMCDYAGEEESLGYNPEFLRDVLGVIVDEDVTFEWNGPAAPARIAEGSYTYVVMPVSLE